MEMGLQPIRTGSVTEIAYERIRSLIVEGRLASEARLHQGQLADSLGISRTSVREALHRLSSESLVDFHPQRGFFVAAPLHLDAVVDRLELRLLLEGGIARLAAERRTDADVAALRSAVRGESKARSARAAHDLSREFHVTVARASRNPELVKTLEALWTVDIGRQLLARRGTSPDWQPEDVAEHEAIAEAIAAGDGALAEKLMREHVQEAYAHWSREAAAEHQ
ncbi:MAG TPA: GntR family transcriptional regulator [Solirubrobacteraceae bacterium]|nr:GntR family transcriptional regulator [Solirubrobacteraceae bacterium]